VCCENLPQGAAYVRFGCLYNHTWALFGCDDCKQTLKNRIPSDEARTAIDASLKTQGYGGEHTVESCHNYCGATCGSAVRAGQQQCYKDFDAAKDTFIAGAALKSQQLLRSELQRMPEFLFYLKDIATNGLSYLKNVVNYHEKHRWYPHPQCKAAFPVGRSGKAEPSKPQPSSVDLLKWRNMTSEQRQLSKNINRLEHHIRLHQDSRAALESIENASPLVGSSLKRCKQRIKYLSDELASLKGDDGSDSWDTSPSPRDSTSLND